ncbi:MAG: FlgD immunoglobulin-like domain containing protein, partial [Candidatus Edwardsbacteria bacterium]|nr:FlgD immunoglobulin-like domain containing protein [Candidatus Edwardsbacteria bacterium]
NFVYAAADSLKELQKVVKTGLADIPWLSESLIAGNVPEGDSVTIAVKFNAKGLLGNKVYKKWLLIKSDDPLSPPVTVPVVLKTNPTGVEGEPRAMLLPVRFALQPNYPNPFGNRTVIRYQIPAAAGYAERKSSATENNVHCRVSIYNLTGQLVKTLVDKPLGPGYYQANWDGKDNSGIRVSSGIYFYRMTAGEFSDIKKLMLMR